MNIRPPSIEQIVKAQFVRLFRPDDWRLFKQMAEYYLQDATSLLKQDVNAPEHLTLLARNSDKRLHIGVGIELLVKAVYLKQGFHINKLKDPAAPKAPTFPCKFEKAEDSLLKPGETFTLGPLIDHFAKVAPAADTDLIKKGLKIAMVFRNKEGHAVYDRHKFDPSNYRDIETALVAVYRLVFAEDLRVRFSMEDNEVAQWEVTEPAK